MLSKKELEKEENYLNKTLCVVKDILKEHDFDRLNLKKEYDAFKDYLWNNQSEHMDEDFGSISFGMNLFEMHAKEKLVKDKNKRIKKLSKSLNTPYFAKVTFKTDEVEDIYIGINSIEKNNNFYVYDWRSNIASMYYNFELGSAYYNTLEGKVNGEILNKRQFNIKNGKLVNVFDSAINIDDEYLQEILSKQTSESMQNIVSTIQKEQNKIIRNDKDKYLIVQGCAGSGKTSVALHRIAYLLYKDINLSSNNVLIFSPNDIFIKYISKVLPELGEENVLNTTFKKFSYSILKESKKIESFTNFVERIHNNKIDNDLKEKLSFGIKEKIDDFFGSYIKNIKFKGSIKNEEGIIKKEELNELLQVRYNSYNLNDRLNFISEFVCRKLKIKLKYKKEVKEFLINNLNLSLNIYDIYNEFLIKNKMLKINKENIFYEDITLLIYIYYKVNGIIHNYNIKHVIIDEVQDYTKLQLYILKNIFSKSTFTILGDINQVMLPISEINSLSELLNGKYIVLNKTYRSTESIINYSNKTLGLNNVCLVRKDNEEKVINKKSENILNLLEDIKHLKNKGYKNIAIITKTKKESLEVYNTLKNKISISFVEEESVDKLKDIVVLPVYLSKGLEYEAVIVYNELGNSYKESEKNLFYIACTRALHSLTIYNN